MSPNPNSPFPLYPQPQTDPLQSRNNDDSPSARADLIFGRFLICSGIFRWFTSPNPNCPFPLFPQLQTVPFASRNKLKCPPAEIEMIGGRLLIFSGVSLFVE